MADSANYIFIPWVQPGVAASIPDQATEKLSADQPAAISLPVKLVVNSDAVEKTARLYGPGDVTGIDPQQVIRVEPRHRTADFEPNYFPAIEFDRPDFPWLFTPAKADSQGRLRPWLCLVAVRKQQGVEFRPAGNQPLPVLEIKAPARPGDELPDLSESHLWSHAQVTGASQSQIKTILESAPARNVSRLLCPRRLAPSTEYIACVVPAFKVGCKAGLNQPVGPADTLEPSWRSGNQAPEEITLPVYYSWEFRTASGGDFEELVRRLEPRKLPVEVGKRPMNISHPGFAMQSSAPADAEATTLGLEGALRVIGSEPDEWPDLARLPFQTALIKILNTPFELATAGGDDKDPVVAPPIYGCWHAASRVVGQGTPPAPSAAWPPAFWLDDLNLDPRNRAVAAMGTQVIQDQQEQLMASAWEQLGEIEKINQRLRQAQLSRAINGKYHLNTFARLPEEAFVKIVAPAQSRVMLEVSQLNQPAAPAVRMLMVRRITESPVPTTAVSAQVRKITRPRGRINRQYSQAGAARVGAMFRVFNTTGIPAQTDAARQNKGAVTIDQISIILEADVRRTGGLVWNPDPPPHWERARAGYPQMLAAFRLSRLSGTAINSLKPSFIFTQAFVDAAKAHQEYLVRAFPPLAFPILFLAGLRPQIQPLDIKNAALVSLNPARTVSQAVLGSVRINSPFSPSGDELEPIMDAPAFPQPMYEALRDLSQDYLFPGLERVPPNTVELLQTNSKFIESFMVGLNAEMGRELLWRDYPTDQRGTYFRQFWDTQSAGAQSQTDITPVHQWGNRPLGATAVGAGEDKLVLLIRGELLRRYPGTIIYVVPATPGADGKLDLSPNPQDEVYPVFRGTLDPDVTFLGFNLTPAQVVAGLGSFFVLQQQPTEPRFGLDDDPFAEGESGKIPDLETWDDLNWAHLAPSAEQLSELSHVSVNNIQLKPKKQGVKGSWGRNSAHMAYITKQLPVRIAIHASELLP